MASSPSIVTSTKNQVIPALVSGFCTKRTRLSPNGSTRGLLIAHFSDLDPLEWLSRRNGALQYGYWTLKPMGRTTSGSASRQDRLPQCKRFSHHLSFLAEHHFCGRTTFCVGNRNQCLILRHILNRENKSQPKKGCERRIRPKYS